jgi:branched-chain amino acid transport system permease protein
MSADERPQDEPESLRTDGAGVGGEASPGPAGAQESLNVFLRDLRNHEFAVIGAAALALLVFPYLLIDGLGALGSVIGFRIGGYEGLASLVLIYGIIVVGFNLLLGYTELLSFGHAAFFGVAAYTAGLLSSTAEISPPFTEASMTMPGIGSPLVMLTAGTLVAILLAWPIGIMSIRRSGVYFAVLTLTFGQMLYFFALGPGAGITNGDNGFADVNVEPLLGVFDLGAELPVVTTVEYLFVGVLFLLALTVANRIINSPYGLILKALGENEQRVAFVGLNVFRYKLMAFIISGAFAGLGGALFIMHEQYIHPTTALYWIQSGDFVIMTVLGGTGSLIAPVFGAFMFEYVSNVISGVTLPVIGPIGSLWRLILGAVFVIIIWNAPRGIYGGLVDLKRASVVQLRRLAWASQHPQEASEAFRGWAALRSQRVLAMADRLPGRGGPGGER